MNKIIGLFFINSVLAISLLQAPSVLFAVENPKAGKTEIVAAANNGMVKYLSKIPAGRESLYGFNSRDEFAIAKTGKPYEVFTLSKEFFSDEKLTNKNYLVSTGEWRVPVTINGENRTLLTVAKKKGEWRVVGIGASGLAKELEKYEREYSTHEDVGSILRVFQLDSDFFMMHSRVNPDSRTVVPLFNSGSLFNESNVQGQKSYSIEEALNVFKGKIANK